MTVETSDPRVLLFGLMRQRAEKMRALNDKAAWLQVIQEEHARETAPLRREIAHLEEQIKAEAVRAIPEGKKSVDVPGYGRIQYRDYQGGVRIVDPEAFIKWAKAAERTDLYEVVTTERLKRAEATKAASDALAAYGEQLPGVEVQPPRREAYIEDRVIS